MRCLLGYVESPRVVVEVPVAGEDFAKYGIQRFLNTRGADVPTTEVKLDDRDESLDGIIDLRYREEHFGVTHEALEKMVSPRHLVVP